LFDLEKRCHYHATTNVKGDSHESAYMEGQRSVLLFIKSMLQNDNEKGNNNVKRTDNAGNCACRNSDTILQKQSNQQQHLIQLQNQIHL